MSEPTMSLSDFIEGEKKDPNLFWRLQSGDHQNLLYEAIEKLQRCQEFNRRLTARMGLLSSHAKGEDG